MHAAWLATTMTLISLYGSILPANDSLVRTDSKDTLGVSTRFEKVNDQFAAVSQPIYVSQIAQADLEAASPIKYGTPRKSPKDPLPIETTRTVVFTVQVPFQTVVRTTERFGLFGHRCRVVCRTVTVMRSESRTREVQSVRFLNAVLSDESSKSAMRDIKLQVPLSAGAITQQIADLLNKEFPVVPGGAQFVRNLNGTTVDYEQDTPVGGVKIVIFIVVQNDPRNVVLTVGVSDENDPAKGQSTANGIADKIEKYLTTVPPT